MRKEKALINYKIAMSVFSGWASQGIICDKDLEIIEGVMAEKYGLLKGSIYRL